MNTQPIVYIIAGPTAVGKTAIAIDLATHMGTAIISADSRQCYKGMVIGTAQPSAAEQQRVKHYFVNAFPVTQQLSAADFEAIAMQYLDEIFAHHNTAVVCGGTGLYIKALCEGLDAMPETDPAIAQQTDQEYETKGIEWLQQAVQQEDPAFFAQGEIYNPARMLRALAFVRSTGHSILQYRTDTVKERPFAIVKVALELPREILYDRINHRVDVMMQQGLLAEVEQLYPQRHLKNLQTVGYTELFDYIDGKCTLPEAIDKIKQHTRNYAKRQMTWFRKDKSFTWMNAADGDVLQKITQLT